MRQRIRYINICKKCGNRCIPITATIFQDVLENNDKNSLVKLDETYIMKCRCGNIATASSLNSVMKKWNTINDTSEY